MASPGAMVNSGPRSEPTQLALALDHAESLAREDFRAGKKILARETLGMVERQRQLRRLAPWPAVHHGAGARHKSARPQIASGVDRAFEIGRTSCRERAEI